MYRFPVHFFFLSHWNFLTKESVLSVIQGAPRLDFADCILRVIQHHVGFGIVLLSFVHMVVLHETAALG